MQQLYPKFINREIGLNAGFSQKFLITETNLIWLQNIADFYTPRQ